MYLALAPSLLELVHGWCEAHGCAEIVNNRARGNGCQKPIRGARTDTRTRSPAPVCQAKPSAKFGLAWLSGAVAADVEGKQRHASRSRSSASASSRQPHLSRYPCYISATSHPHIYNPNPMCAEKQRTLGETCENGFSWADPAQRTPGAGRCCCRRRRWSLRRRPGTGLPSHTETRREWSAG